MPRCRPDFLFVGSLPSRRLVCRLINSLRVPWAFLRQFGANATKHSDHMRKHLRQNAQKGAEMKRIAATPHLIPFLMTLGRLSPSLSFPLSSRSSRLVLTRKATSVNCAAPPIKSAGLFFIGQHNIRRFTMTRRFPNEMPGLYARCKLRLKPCSFLTCFDKF